ncbi:MAG: hypothetical protein IJ524_08820 [Bacteroidales bacterium]|nr:hypothetical protein [Bacteroidales bacterium]
MNKTKYFVLFVLVLLSNVAFAQKVAKVERVKEDYSVKNDSRQYQWKLYRYEDGSCAAFSSTDKRITPNVSIRPFYIGGELFRVATKEKNEYGNIVIAVYNEQGEKIIPEELSCIDVFYNGNGIFKLSKKNKNNVVVWAVYDKKGNSIVPFDKGYAYVSYYPAQQTILCKDNKGADYFYGVDGRVRAGHANNAGIDLGANSTDVSTIRDTVVTLSFGSYKWTKVTRGGVATLYGESDALLIPLSRGYNDIQFVSVKDHIGYFKTRRNGKYGVCDVYGNEILPTWYQQVAYTPEKGFYCDNGNYVSIWLDVNGMPCERDYRDMISMYVKGAPKTRRTLAVFPFLPERKSVLKFIKYNEDGIVWTDRISKSNQYTDIRVRKDGPYYVYGDTVNYLSYHVFNGRNVGIHEYYKKKKIISPDREYTNITAINVTNNARNNIRCYLVEKGDLYGACDEKGKEIIAPVYKSLRYDEKKGFVTRTSTGQWKSIGIYFSSNGKLYKSSTGNLYQKNMESADEALEKERYVSAINSYSEALKYDQSAYAFYNYGVALYNNGDYRKARSAFDKAYWSAEREKNNDLATSALRLKGQSDDRVKQRSKERWTAVAEVGLYALGMTAAVMAASAATVPTYGTPTYGTPTSSTSTYQMGDGPDAAIANANRIMQQSTARMQYEMSTVQQRLMQQTEMQMAAQEAAKEAQWRRDYENYRNNPGYNLNADGTLFTWEQYKQWRRQVEAQAWAESQQQERAAGQESNMEPERQQGKKWQYKTEVSDCPHCDIPGNGKCKICGGDGLMDEGFGLGVNCQKCSSCYNQSGKCRFCNGTGKKKRYTSEFE